MFDTQGSAAVTDVENMPTSTEIVETLQAVEIAVESLVREPIAWHHGRVCAQIRRAYAARQLADNACAALQGKRRDAARTEAIASAARLYRVLEIPIGNMRDRRDAIEWELAPLREPLAILMSGGRPC